MRAESDYYTVLGISPEATPEEIKRAFRALAQRYHPDSRTEAVGTTMFHDVQAAYAVLSDPPRRRAYDRVRSELGQSQEAPISWDMVVSRARLSSLFEEQALYLLIGIGPAAGVQGERLPLNLCLVVDRSSSMRGARLEHVKAAAHQIIDEMHEDDALAVVSFSDRAEVVLPNTRPINRHVARAKVSSIWADGGTEILQGLQLGLAELAKRHGPRVTNHLILLTDGRTYGDEQLCIQEAQRAGAERIGITAMGIGEDWNESMLDEIAAQSGGVSAYIASPGQVRSLLQQKVRGLGAVFAQGVQLQIRCLADVKLESVFRVSPYLERLSAPDGLVQLGSLEADSSQSVVLELVVGQKPEGEHRIAQFELTADVPARGLQGVRLMHNVVCAFSPTNNYSDAVPADIVNALGKVTLFSMQEQAWKALERGEVKKATGKLELVATRLLDLGEAQLAQAALLEAGRIARRGTPSSKGRKEIRYGTRSLATAPRTSGYGRESRG